MAKKKLEGIGGWLLLPTIGLFGAAAIWIFNFITWGIIIFSGRTSIYAITVFVSSIILGSLSIYSLILEFKKKKEFPTWAIATMWISVILGLVVGAIDGIFSGTIQSIIGSIIWTWYFNVSKRVKNTFVN